MLISFIATYWADILLSLITAGLLAFCRYLWKELKVYRAMLEEQDHADIVKQVSKQIDPLVEEISEMKKRIEEYEAAFQLQIESILSSYRYRLMFLCRQYLERGSMTSEELEQLTEFFKVYSDLGGNGKAKMMYERTLELPIKDA